MNLMRQAQRTFTGLHSRIYRLSGGRIGGKMGSAEAVLLTTTGRRSGAPRVTPLTVVPDGDRLILIASNGGAQKHPDWYFNLTADPDVVVQRQNEVLQMRARTAGPDERAVLWPKAVAIYGGYTGYQHRTDREIPVVICEPRPA
jgi:deazaflavin-dependent oxidoreductase (nitroreductase family)